MNGLLHICLLLLTASPVMAAGTVTLALDSPQHGLDLTPGAQVSWSINADVSTADNLGLALVLVDLQQDSKNPQPIELLPAADVPAGMDGFARPGGISNPGTGLEGSGYGGTPVDVSGAVQVLQIGGAQNIFGTPIADDLGQDVSVDPGVGQSPGGQMIAGGSFSAPAASGIYTIALEAAVAHTLDQVQAPPQPSQVAAAVVELAQSTITFTVIDSLCVGDIDGNGVVDVGDLLDLLASWGLCPGCAADLDGNEVVNVSDLLMLLAAWGPCT